MNRLHCLKFLVLSGNHLKGTLPQHWDAASSRLTLLSLGGNMVRWHADTSPHAVLLLLTCGHQLEGSIPADLIALPSMRVVQLSGNRFSGMVGACCPLMITGRCC